MDKFLLRDGGISVHVKKNVEGLAEATFRQVHIIARRVFRRVGVHTAALAFHGNGDIERATLFGAFKEHVLNKVRAYNPTFRSNQKMGLWILSGGSANLRNLRQT